MSWEASLLRKTRLGAHRHCLALVEAYADFAPLWERCCLLMYAGLGPGVARFFGADSSAMWRSADEIIADLLAVSRLSPREVASLLRSYVQIKLEDEEHLPLEEARVKIYDKLFYPIVTHFTYALQPSAAARLKFVRETVKSINEDQLSFADLGCGAGMMLCEVLTMKPGWRGHGFDISPAAIRYAQDLSRHKGVAERASFRTGDIARLPFETESLDLLIASEVIEHMQEPAQAIRELARVLRPGGRLILTMPLESHTPAHAHTLDQPDDFRSLCESAGLSVQTLKSKWHFGYGDDNKHIFAVALKPLWAAARIEDQLQTLSNGLSATGAFA
jgi:ubiquinone/menaquinone biosynthesis C-methylase UbiE